jgi:Toastrack DUF4097
MKFSLVPALLGILISLAGPLQAHEVSNENSSERIERSMPVDPRAQITLCVMSGALTVRGWDKNEVRTRSTDADEINFRRVDKAKDASVPATRVDVMVIVKHGPRGDCQSLADVEMDVPKDATVQVQTRDGDIYITGVAGAYAGSQNGDIVIERASKFVEAGVVGGSISLKDSTGRINLSSAGGGVDVHNVRPVDPDDGIDVGTVSGDIQLEQVTNQKLAAKTVNGTITMTGALAKKGQYGFTTMGGDVILSMPRDASFTLNARVSEKGDIVSDFPLKYLPEVPPPAPAADPAPKPAPKSSKVTPAPKTPPQTSGPSKQGPVIAPIVVVKPVIVNPFRRFTAICGNGDATISLSSFGGTLHLKRMITD